MTTDLDEGAHALNRLERSCHKSTFGHCFNAVEASTGAWARLHVLLLGLRQQEPASCSFALARSNNLHLDFVANTMLRVGGKALSRQILEEANSNT